MIPPVGSVWEECESCGWLVVSEPRTDHEDGTVFVLMALLYNCNGRPIERVGHVEGVPVDYMKSDWVRVS